VLVAPSRGDAQMSAERLLKHFIEGGESLRKVQSARQPGAIVFATFWPRLSHEARVPAVSRLPGSQTSYKRFTPI
jgi:hypothetical protein